MIPQGALVYSFFFLLFTPDNHSSCALPCAAGGGLPNPALTTARSLMIPTPNQRHLDGGDGGGQNDLHGSAANAGTSPLQLDASSAPFAAAPTALSQCWQFLPNPLATTATELRLFEFVGELMGGFDCADSCVWDRLSVAQQCAMLSVADLGVIVF